MAFPEQYSSFVRDVKTLVQKRPIAASTVFSVMALVAIATIIIPTLQRFFASNDPASPDSTVTQDLSDGEINAGNTPLSNDDIRTGADIDSLEVLLNEIELEPPEATDGMDDLERSRATEQRRPSTASLNPIRVANESTGQSPGNEATSIYDDLFSPITVQAPSAIEANLPPITPGTVATEDTANVSTAAQASPSAEWWDADASASPSDANSLNTTRNDMQGTRTESPIQSLSAPVSPQQSPQSLSNPVSLDSAPPMPLQPDTSSLQPAFNTVPFQTSPLPGTTGYTTPDALRSPFNPYTQPLNPSAVPASPGAVATPNLPGALMVPLNETTLGQPATNLVSPSGVSPSPFITPSLPTAQPTYTVPQNTFTIPPAPSTVPPRFTGSGRGGEFNTFSNP